MKNLENLVSKVDSFPTLPTIYTSLLEVTSNPRSTIQDIANVIMKDQSSVTQILKIVNSSLFGIQTRVSTVSQAIFFLGFNEVKNIVLALSIMDLVSGIKNKSEFNVVDFWKHSIAVGVITRLIGVHLNVKDLENYFIAGLIHDIGKLFFISEVGDIYGKVVNKVREDKAFLTDYEKKVFNMHHDYVGELLAMKWKLPVPIRNVIKYHNIGIVDGKVDLLIACTHLANIIAQMMELGDSGDGTIRQPNFEIWNVMNFSAGTFAKMYDSIMMTYYQSASILMLKDSRE